MSTRKPAKYFVLVERSGEKLITNVRVFVNELAAWKAESMEYGI